MEDILTYLPVSTTRTSRCPGSIRLHRANQDEIHGKERACQGQLPEVELGFSQQHRQ